MENANAVIKNSCVTGTITGKGNSTGGLIGNNSGATVSNCYSSATISGQTHAGGLIGTNYVLVGGSYATGTVSGNQCVGGLVGNNYAPIDTSYATGEVIGSSSHVGGLVGQNESIITNSYADGKKVTATASVGGLVGYNNGGTISESYANNAVTMTSTSENVSVGGLIGYNNAGNVNSSYATGNVVGTSIINNNSYAGGLIGTNYGAGLVSDSYATGNVTLDRGSYNRAGGLIGQNYGNTGISVIDSYATGKVTTAGSSSSSGGLIALRNGDSSIIASSYYDKETTGQKDTTVASPKTTAEMKQRATFDGWDFTNTWTIDEGNDYPKHQWDIGVKSTPVEGVSLDKNSQNLEIDETFKLTATITPVDAINKNINWSSSDTKIATVDKNGSVTAKAAGTAKITVTTEEGGYTATCTITVQEEPKDQLLEIAATPATLSLTVGDTKPITIEARYSSGKKEDISSDKIEWETADSKVATVSKGAVTAISQGFTEVTATCEGKTVNIKVSVNEVITEVETEKFGRTYWFSELLSNTSLLNEVLSEYTARELKVIVPEKYLKSVEIVHAENIMTNIDIYTASGVRKVFVKAGNENLEAKRIATTTFNFGRADLTKGTELIISLFDADNHQLDSKVIRLREGNSVIENNQGKVKSGSYIMLNLISDNTLFNTIMSKFSLSELTVGLPMRYIEDVTVDYNVYTTTFTIRTTGDINKVSLKTEYGEEWEAIAKGNGIYERDISGLKPDDTVTILIYDNADRIAEQKLIFID